MHCKITAHLWYVVPGIEIVLQNDTLELGISWARPTKT